MKVAFFFATVALVGVNASKLQATGSALKHLQSSTTIDVDVDLTKTEVETIQGQPSPLGLCSAFPPGEYFLQRAESMPYNLLPVNMANVKPNSKPATQKAHYQRLIADLPDPVSFGQGFTQFGLQGGPLTHPIVTSAELLAESQQKEAEERAAREAELQAKLAEEKRAKEAAEREAESRRLQRQMKQEERDRRRQLHKDQLEAHKQRIRELEARAVCRELTKGKIDAKAHLNIVGDEAIIEVEETVPCGHRHRHHKHRKHHKKAAVVSDCGCTEDKELKEESSCVKKETALAAALAKEAEDAKQACACAAAKPLDPLIGALDSTKQLSGSLDKTIIAAINLAKGAEKPPTCNCKPNSAPIEAAKTIDKIDDVIGDLKSMVVAPKVINIPYTVAPSCPDQCGGHHIVHKNESNCKSCGFSTNSTAVKVAEYTYPDLNVTLAKDGIQTTLAQIDSDSDRGCKTGGGKHDNQVIEISCYDTWNTPAILIELSRGSEATILVRKPNKGVNTSHSDSISTFWVETQLSENKSDDVYRLSYEGKFYKSRDASGGWTRDGCSKCAGDWPYYGWTITANDEFEGLGAFLLEGALLTCPSESLRFNEYEDKAYRVVVKVID